VQVTDPPTVTQEKEREVADTLASIKDVLEEVVTSVSKEKQTEMDNATLSNHLKIKETLD